MSYNVNIYCGPYVNCRSTERTVKTVNCKEPDMCPLLAVVDPKSTPKFCPKCGIKSKDRVTEETEDTHAEDARQDLEETGVSLDNAENDDDSQDEGSDHFFKPWIRRHVVAPRSFELRDPMTNGCGQALNITGIDQQAEMEWLANAAPKAIAYLREVYGAENVSVRWGLRVSGG